MKNLINTKIVLTPEEQMFILNKKDFLNCNVIAKDISE